MTPRYIVRQTSGPWEPQGKFLVASRQGARKGFHETQAEADAHACRLNGESYYQTAIGSLQFLDEIGGPEPRQYVNIMRRLAAECERRAKACEDAHSAAAVWTAEGFSLVDTGGGCKAFQRDSATDGTYILVTASNDPDVPDFAHEPVSVGLYVQGEGGEAIAHVCASTSYDAARKIKAGEWTKGNFR